jgi:hypothetical protein
MARSLGKTGASLAVVSLLTTVAVLHRAEALEGECGRNPAACDLQPTRTLLRSQIWRGADCKPSQWEGLPRVGFPFDGAGKLQLGLRAPAAFLAGVCHARSPNGGVEQGIAELQAAQSGDLFPAQRNVASLYEGLLHCRKLRTLDRSRLDRSLSTRTAFCTARSMAKASFSRVAWPHLELAYESDAATSLDAHVEEMSQCYGELLHGGYDATCGVVSAPSPAQIERVARDAADTVLTSYFGDSAADRPDAHGAPPLKAMLARKIAMADGALADSSSLFEQLTQKTGLLSTSYSGVAEPYCAGSDPSLPCAGDIPRRVGRLHDAYEHAVLAAQDLLSFADRWVDGQYTNNGVDVRTGLRQRSNDLALVLASLKEPSRPNELSLGDKLARVKSDMRTLASSSANAQATLRRVCAVYFCELRRRSPVGFNATCNKHDDTTGGRIGDANLLCATDLTQTFVSSDRTTTALGLCEGAQFTREAMTTKNVDTCMAEYHR